MSITDRVRDARSALERLESAIPGFAGYKEKEMRREADRLLRTHLAGSFQQQRGRLTDLQTRLSDSGQLRVVLALERCMMRLQLLIDRLKTATYGYGGWFDAVKVNNRELDALYSFDDALHAGVEEVGEWVEKLAVATEEQVLLAVAEDLASALEGLNDAFSMRQDAILDLEESTQEKKKTRKKKTKKKDE